MRIAILLGLAVCAQAQRVIAVNVDSIIHPVTAEIISHAIDQASRENASAVLLRLNTPGGLMDAMRDTMLLPVVLLGVGAVSCLALRQGKRGAPPEPTAAPATAASSDTAPAATTPTGSPR